MSDDNGRKPRESGVAETFQEGAAASEEIVAAAGAAVTAAVQDLGGFIRAQRESAQVSLRQLAKLAGVSNPYLSQIERGLRKPSAEVLQQIAKGLRVSAEVLYVQAGILEEKNASPVLDAVLTDTQITERQKQMLIEIYDSFRRENVAAEQIAPPTDHA
ncbi:helix-turn-helix transcriptional regulator [Rhodococcus sp. X156]|uniref:helix-turn-helix domain-containing protein n=1 Tax=Rhodococcus sp. X156 TaxID=2499145 RepID=UPI000FD74AB8|nr:helix-turn-helix transcriptional regulator [Rhodococcus sp. X156]